MQALTFPLTDQGLATVNRRIRGRVLMLLGLTGGIASGKSTVSSILEERGARLIDFDVLSRQVVKPGEPALRDITAHFGQDVLRPDGTLDRRHLSRLVFNDARQRRQLEGFTHPAIFRAFFHALDRLSTLDPSAIVQVSIPLLIELHLMPLFDKLLLVFASPETQRQRLIRRDGISRQQAQQMIDAQMSIQEKRAFANYIIDNDGSLEETRQQVAATWQIIRGQIPEIGTNNEPG